MLSITQPHAGRTALRACAAATLIATLLTGCQWDRELEYGAHTSRFDSQTSSNDFEWHQTELAHLVRFAPGSGMVDPVEMVRLNQFIDQVGVQSNDEVKAIVGGPLAQQRADAVVQAFALRGYRITPQIDPYAVEDDVTVNIRRVVYTASACLGDGYPFRDGSTSLPLGCATALNLQRMVANPDELINNLGSDAVETIPAVGAIQRYRRGEITPLRNQSTTSD